VYSDFSFLIFITDEGTDGVIFDDVAAVADVDELAVVATDFDIFAMDDGVTVVAIVGIVSFSDVPSVADMIFVVEE